MRYRRSGYVVIRSVILAVSTLAIVGVLFAIYQSATGVPAPPAAERARAKASVAQPPTSSEKSRSLPLEQGALGPGDRVAVRLYEPESNRARLELYVRSWEPMRAGDQEFHLVEPEIRMRTPDGQIVKATADEGWIQLVKRVQNTYEPKGGHLSGSVHIELDRLTDEQRAALPAGQRDARDPDRLVTLDFAEITFDLEQARVASPGTFTLSMAEGELRGEGVHLRYNEVDARVEHFEIERGGSILLRAGREVFGDLFASDGATGESAADGPADAPDHARWQETTQTDRRPDDDNMVPGEPREGDKGTDDVPVFHPAHGKQRTAPAVQTYLATVKRDVQIERVDAAGVQQRLGADRIDVLFGFEARRQEEVSGRLGQGASSQTGGGAVGPRQGTADAVRAEKAPDRFAVHWGGPLVIRPEPQSEAPSPEAKRRVRVRGVGSPVRYSDRRFDLSCASFDVHTDERRYWIRGSEEYPVSARGKDGSQLRASSVFVDDEAGMVTIAGPAMLAGARRGEAAGDMGAQLARRAEIRFDERAELSIGERVMRPAAAASDAAAGTRHIEKAAFFGDVQMTQGGDLIAADTVRLAFDPPPQAGGFVDSPRSLGAQGQVLMMRGEDRVTCDDLEVAFTRAPDGGLMPSEAVASDDVVITQRSLAVTARDRVAIGFVPVVDASVEGRPGASHEYGPDEPVHSEPKYTIGMRSIQAAGQVTAFDDTRGLDLAADTLSATLSDGRDMRTVRIAADGDRPAFVQFGTFGIEAGQIDADFSSQRADVYGPGELTFVTTRGLDGSRADSPQSITVAWTQEMTFRGAANTARFVGDVRATTRRDVAAAPTLWERWFGEDTPTRLDTSSLACGELVVDFVDKPPAPQPEEVPTDRWWVFAPLVASIEGTSESSIQLDKEPTYVVASDDVAGVFTSALADGRVINRVRIESDSLSLDLRGQLLTAPSAGSLLIEDYESGASAKRQTGATGPTPFIQAPSGMPSQSFIRWSQSMSFLASRLRADFQGAVRLVHRAGSQLIGADKLAAVSGAGAGRGRITRLDCEGLLVEFRRAADQNDAESQSGIARMSLRDLVQLDATGGVYLVDNDITINAYRVAKFDHSQLIWVFGRGLQDAEIYSRSPLGPRFSGTEFSYNLVSGKVEAAGTRVGARR